MGVYQQHFVDRLPMEKTAVQHLRDRFQDEDYQSIRNRLGKYGTHALMPKKKHRFVDVKSCCAYFIKFNYCHFYFLSGLEGHAHEVTMRDLSGGQKARVVFVELSLQRPHVLLLGKPFSVAFVIPRYLIKC